MLFTVPEVLSMKILALEMKDVLRNFGRRIQLAAGWRGKEVGEKFEVMKESEAKEAGSRQQGLPFAHY